MILYLGTEGVLHIFVSREEESIHREVQSNVVDDIDFDGKVHS